MSLEVEASNRAFAALLLDGSVTAWGDPQWGGHLDDSEVLVFFWETFAGFSLECN